MANHNPNHIGIEHPENYISRSGNDRVYLDFYHLKEAPFSITPDPEFLFLSNTHQSVLDKVLYGINNRMGFILLTGEVGTGKTTLCRSILDKLDGMAEMVYIINPSLSGRELISSILDDLGVDYAEGSSKKDLIDHLNRFSLSATQTKPVVIIIDDAQTMPVDSLEDLRLLSNLETDKEKLLQVVLVGQPELIDLISRPEIRQLRQRVTITCYLDFLTPAEVEGYIARRLFIAGDKGQVRFTRKAKQQIARVSGGIPRLINKICDYALTSGYIANAFTIGPKHVKRALTELGDLDFKKDPLKTKTRDRPGETYGQWIRYPVYGLVFLMITLLSIHFFYSNILTDQVKTKRAPSPITNTPRKDTVSEPKPGMSMPGGSDQTVKSLPLSAETIPKAPDATQPESHADPSPIQNVGEEKTGPVYASAIGADKTTPDGTGSAQASMKTADTMDVPASGLPIRSNADEFRSGFSFILQFGSYRTINRTMTAYYQYMGKKIDVHWNRVDLGEKGIWYRLFTGRFESKEAAAKYKKDHGLAESIIVFTPWTVRVAEAASQQECDKIRSVLRDNRIDYYTLDNPDGTFRILTGAFVTEEGAKKLSQDITGLGYDARVVLR